MKEMDFLSGRSAANLAYFALTALGANLLQSADQVVDMLVVGMFAGKGEVAALANATMLGFVANSLLLGLAVGATVLVPRRLGAGETDGISRAEGHGTSRGRGPPACRRAVLRVSSRPALRGALGSSRRTRGRHRLHTRACSGAAGSIFARGCRRHHARPWRRANPGVACCGGRRGQLRRGASRSCPHLASLVRRGLQQWHPRSPLHSP
ncbi:hypothetical protein HGI81_01620 [Olsenella sp. KGMB02461]|nr:hypothetical protein [Olsenella sp. KGMB02461]